MRDVYLEKAVEASPEDEDVLRIIHIQCPRLGLISGECWVIVGGVGAERTGSGGLGLEVRLQ